jgi:hypothetical protein
MTLFEQRIIERLHRVNPRHPAPKAPIGIIVGATAKLIIVVLPVILGFLTSGTVRWTLLGVGFILAIWLAGYITDRNFPSWRRRYYNLRRAYIYLSPVEQALCRARQFFAS